MNFVNYIWDEVYRVNKLGEGCGLCSLRVRRFFMLFVWVWEEEGFFFYVVADINVRVYSWFVICEINGF